MSGEISKGTLTEDAFSEIERLINASIHELVFALQHLDQSGDGSDPEDDIESAQSCLTTAGMNVDRIQEMISGSAV